MRVPRDLQELALKVDRAVSELSLDLHRQPTVEEIGAKVGAEEEDVLEALGRGEGPRDVLISLGYAGWSAGQLEQEIAQNAWLTVAADPDVLFDTPIEGRLPAAMKLLGIEFSRLSEHVGHA